MEDTFVNLKMTVEDAQIFRSVLYLSYEQLSSQEARSEAIMKAAKISNELRKIGVEES